MIDPERLKALRKDRNLSRDRLADEARVSSRQIARIEGATENVAARTTTIERLARALKVDPNVLSGAAPLPPDVDGSTLGESLIDPSRLRHLRKAIKGWSRERLAEKSRVSVRQIARIEAAETVTPVRAATVKRLARALGVHAATLKEPLDPDRPIPDDVRISAKVSPRIRLAYDLIERRYGPSAQQLIVLAPLFFTLLAEASLTQRRRKLEQVCEAIEGLVNLGRGDVNIDFFGSIWEIEECAERERKSIESADLLDDVPSNDYIQHDIAPFAQYLRGLADDIGPQLVSFGVDQVLDDYWVVDPYEICSEELDEVTGGSQRAKYALEYGDVRLSDVPVFLYFGDEDQRNLMRKVWLEDQLSDRTADLMERRQQVVDEPTLDLERRRQILHRIAEIDGKVQSILAEPILVEGANHEGH